MDIKKMNYYPATSQFPFWIQKNVHDLQDSPDMHGHEFVELIFVVEGMATHRFQDITYPIRAGDIFIINPGEVHGYTTESGRSLEIVNCLFTPDLIHDSLLRELKISNSMDFYYVQPFLNKEARFHHRLNLQWKDREQALDLLNGMIQEVKDQFLGYQAYVRMQMIQLLVLLSRYYEKSKAGIDIQSNSAELIVRRIRGYIERNYDKKISLASLSQLFYIGIRQLNRQFNKYVGCSVIKYVQKVRLQKAKSLLVETDQIISAIANAVGYEDAAYFSALFTREIGVSPGKYRENHKGVAR